LAFLREEGKRTATVKAGKQQVELIKIDKESFDIILPKITEHLKDDYDDL